MENSFYCGDAAGRPATAIRKKDFSADDRNFALNCGLKFELPESIFLEKNVYLGNEKEKIEEEIKEEQFIEVKTVEEEQTTSIIDQEVILGAGPGAEMNLTKDQPREIIIFVGSPGSGKSTFSKNYLSSYERLNRDTLNTAEACLKRAKEILSDKTATCSVIIDNTNRDAKTRNKIINLASELNVPCRVI